jgi:general secretion pathway protein D
LGLALAAFGCAGQQAFMAGERYFQQGDYDQAMTEFAVAAAAEPERHEYRMKWLESRHLAALAHFQRGREQAEQGNLAAAADE